ncbi:MAG: DUF6152 family protein [Steroidobacteraceae bacterium]
MNRLKKPMIVSISLLASVLSAAALAHHSSAVYAGKKTQTAGTVKKWQWTNPHAFLWLVVSDGKGGTAEAGYELGSPNTLIRNGFTAKTFAVGDKATVLYTPRRDGQPGGGLEAVYVNNQGKWLQWGPGADVAAAKEAAAKKAGAASSK